MVRCYSLFTVFLFYYFLFCPPRRRRDVNVLVGGVFLALFCGSEESVLFVFCPSRFGVHIGVVSKMRQLHLQ